jgi:hypothetical protein
VGTFDQWLKSKGKWGGQHKVLRLSGDRNMLKEVLLAKQWIERSRLLHQEVPHEPSK